jgi:hypothetical protein
MELLMCSNVLALNLKMSKQPTIWAEGVKKRGNKLTVDYTQHTQVRSMFGKEGLYPKLLRSRWMR